MHFSKDQERGLASGRRTLPAVLHKRLKPRGLATQCGPSTSSMGIPGSWLEMQNLRPHLQSTGPEPAFRQDPQLTHMLWVKRQNFRGKCSMLLRSETPEQLPGASCFCPRTPNSNTLLPYGSDFRGERGFRARCTF